MIDTTKSSERINIALEAQKRGRAAPESNYEPNSEAVGHSKGELSTKIHVLVDALDKSNRLTSHP